MINWQATEKTARDKKLPSLLFFEKKVKKLCVIWYKTLSFLLCVLHVLAS